MTRKKLAQTRVVLARVRRTESIAALPARVPARPPNSIAIAVTQSVAVISKPVNDTPRKIKERRQWRLFFLQVPPRTLSRIENVQKLSGEFGPRARVFVFEEKKSLFPILIANARGPLHQVLF